MLITVHRPASWDALRAAGRSAAATLEGLAQQIRPGVSPRELDAWVRADTAARGGRPSQLGYEGFPASVCVSVNDVVCHGIPGDEPLREGDIVNTDVTTELGGWHGDTSRTFCVGRVSELARRLVHTTERAMLAGIAAARPGAPLGAVGAAVQRVAEADGFSVVVGYGGHGIGRRMHLPPHVHHVGPAGRGPRLVPGMAFTVEPMLNSGTADTRLAADGWTVHTADGGLSAQFEHTVLITEEGPEILTLPPARAAAAR